MTIQQHASFDSSAAELNATSKLVKAWESKNAKNAARAGGVSLMALSLAACNGSDSTPENTTTTGSDTKTTVTPIASDFTNGSDKVVGTADNNEVTAGLVYTPGGNDRINSLQDEDVVDLGEGDDILNATLGNSNDNGDMTVTPTINNTETVNVAFSGSGSQAVSQLDLQDTSGITTFNITRVNDGIANTVTIDNAKGSMVNLGIANSEQPTQIIDFAYDDEELAGGSDEATVTVDNVDVAGLIIDERGAADEGFETINMVVSSSSEIATFTAEDLVTLNISGAGNLTIGNTYDVDESAGGNKEAIGFTAGMVEVGGSLETVDASKMTGDLTYHIGAEIDATKEGTTSGLINMTITGGEGDDHFVLNDGADVGGAAANTDIIDGGEGTDTLTVAGTATIAAATTANLRSIETLEVRGGHDAGVGADTVTIDFDAFDADVASVFVRNEGHDDDAANTNDTEISASEVLTTNLNDMSETESDNIVLAHGNNNNNGVSNNNVNVTFKTDSAENSVGVQLIDDLGNQDAVFNMSVTAEDAEDVTIADDDSESNSMDLDVSGATQAGSTLTVTGGTAGQYLNLDNNTDGADDTAAAGGTYAGYGYTTSGASGSSTTAVATAEDRDTAVDSVLYGAADDATGIARHDFEVVSAGTFTGDLVMRLDDVTLADGVTSMTITTGSGDDTLIFDAQDTDNAGFTSADTVAMGTGTDTLVIDGDTADEPGTPRIDHQASEWDNVTGVDVLRYGDNDGVANGGVHVASNAGAYYARIDNEFIDQTDAGNRLTVINNDGDLARNTESDLVLDLRGVNQSNYVTFEGADAEAAAAGNKNSNRLILDDVSMNDGMVLNGGDSLTGTNTTADNGNLNTLEVRDTANVSVDDLSNVSNFDVIEFTSVETSLQTLTLTLNNTIVEQMVDANSTASATAVETLNINVGDVTGAGQATNGALVVNAGSVTGFLSLDIDADTGEANADHINVNTNLGGSGHNIAVDGGTDRVDFEGTVDGAMAITFGATGSVVVNNQAANVQTTHTVTNAEIIDMSSVTGQTAADTNTVTGSTGNDIYVGTGAIDTVDMGAGNDDVTFGAGVDIFAQDLADSTDVTAVTFAGATVAAGDTITFGDGVDVIRDFTAGTGGDILDLDDTAAGGGLETLIGEDQTDLDDDEVLFASGSFNEATGVFTIAADGAGADTLILSSDDGAAGESDAVATNDNAIILIGVDSDDLVAADNIA